MKIAAFALLAIAISAVAQTSDSAQSTAAKRQASKSKDEVTEKGCVSRLNGDYILMQTDPGVSYQLQATGKLKLRHYLGQQVEVTGVKLPTLGTSSDFVAKAGVASPETITVDSIKTIQNRCSGD
jgi:hypothetical protein